MKKKKTKLFMSLSVLFICFLISSSSLNVVNTKALFEEEYNKYELDSFDRFTWKWSTTEVVSTEITNSSARPSLTVDSEGNIHVVWIHGYIDMDTFEEYYYIFYKHLDVETSSWTTSEFISTESTGNSDYPSIAVDSAGNVHIAWRDSANYAGSGSDMDIFYKRWNASSSLWTTTEVVSTESTGYSYVPSLAVDAEGNVHITWNDLTNYAGSGIDEDIFYKHWDASTSLWTTTEVVSTESTDLSLNPSLDTDVAGTVHIAWSDKTDYVGAGPNYDIFYKRFEGPPAAPELAFIVPNPTELSTVSLDWNNVFGATTYYVYRSPSYIWSVEGLVPIITVSSSDYFDSVPSEGFYYYVIVAGNFAGNSSHSNCQYVEVKFADLDAPELAPILPNPTDSSSISLVWDSVDGATEYYIYRSASYIWSVEGLTPITTVVTTSYIDSLPSEGYYFYTIVANDGVLNSTHSNCEYVEYKVPHLREFSIVSGLILASFVLVFVVTRIRKRNFKEN